MIVAVHQKGYVFYRGFAQAIWLRLPFFQRRDEREIGAAFALQVQGIFVAKLPIEVWNARDGLHKISSGFAACMNHLEECAYQSALPICWVAGDNFRATDGKGDTFVFPFMLPQTGAGHNRMALFAAIFHDSI